MALNTAVCTEHLCPWATLVKSTVVRCFLPTQPVDRGAQYTLFTGCVQGYWRP